jgi:hypothetical protein
LTTDTLPLLASTENWPLPAVGLLESESVYTAYKGVPLPPEAVTWSKTALDSSALLVVLTVNGVSLLSTTAIAGSTYILMLWPVACPLTLTTTGT